MIGHSEQRTGAGWAANLATLTEAWARVLLRVLEAVPTSWTGLVRVTGVVAIAACTALSTAAACGPLDFQCKADAWGQGLVDGLRGSLSSLTQSMIEGIFTGSLGTLGEGGWTAGITLAGRVGAIMAIVVVALAALQIVTTLVAKQRQGILRAAIGAALAWPVASTAVWGAMQLVRVIDAISGQMINDSHIQTLSNLTGFTMAVGLPTPVTASLVALFFVFFVFIPTLLLSLVMAFRNYGIVLAVAIAPVSLMVWGFGSLREMSRGWLKVVLALILTKPVLALALVLAAEMIVQSASDLEIGGFLTGVAGLGMAVFAPFAAMGMVSGAMAIADSNIMRGAEAGAGRLASRAAHSVGQGAKKAGHRVAESAAKSNPKTAALWNFAHGIKPGSGNSGDAKPPADAGQPDPGKQAPPMGQPTPAPGQQQPAHPGDGQQQGREAKQGAPEASPAQAVQPERPDAPSGQPSGGTPTPEARRPGDATPDPVPDQSGDGHDGQGAAPRAGGQAQATAEAASEGRSSGAPDPQSPMGPGGGQGSRQRPSGGPKLT